MRKRTWSVLLVLALCLGLLLGTASAETTQWTKDDAPTCNGHSAADGWTAINYHQSGDTVGSDYYTSGVVAMEQGGKFYLANDITDGNFKNAVNIAYGKTVILCLNGHKLATDTSFDPGEPLFHVTGGGTLILCDCSTGHTGTIEINSTARPSAVVALGDITPNQDEPTRPHYDDATFVMYGGNIVVSTPLKGRNQDYGKNDDRLAAVAVGRNNRDYDTAANNWVTSIFKMYGGTITVNSGAVVEGTTTVVDAITAGNNATVELYGGTVNSACNAIKSTALDFGTNVLVTDDASITGDVILSTCNSTQSDSTKGKGQITGTTAKPMVIHGNIVVGQGTTVLTNVKATSLSSEGNRTGSLTLDAFTAIESGSGTHRTYRSNGTDVTITGSTLPGTDFTLSEFSSTQGKLTVTGSTIGAVNGGEVALTHTTADAVQGTTVTLTNTNAASVTGDTVTLESSTLTGAAAFTGSLSLKGAVKLPDVKMTRGQKLIPLDALTGADIGVSYTGFGTIVDAHGYGTLSASQIHAATGYLGTFTYGTDGSVSVLSKIKHGEVEYTTYTNGADLSKGGHYYIESGEGITLPITIPAGAEVTFCLHLKNGAALENASGSVFINHGTLHLTTCDGYYGRLHYTGTDANTAAVVNNGTLDVPGTLDIFGGSGIGLHNKGTISSLNGNVTITSSGSCALLNEGGSIPGSYAKIYINEGGSGVAVKVSGGEVHLKKEINYIYNYGTALEVVSGTVTSTQDLDSSSTTLPAVIVHNGTVTLNDEIYSKSTSAPALRVNGGTVTVESVNAKSITGDGSAAVEVNGGSLTFAESSTIDTTAAYGVKVAAGATANMASVWVSGSSVTACGISNAGTATVSARFLGSRGAANSGTLTIVRDYYLGECGGTIENSGGTLIFQKYTSGSSELGYTFTGTINGGNVTLARGTYAASGSDYAIATSGTVTLNGAVNLSGGVCLKTGGSIALGENASAEGASVYVAMETPGVFASSVPADYDGHFYGIGNYAVSYDSAAQTLSLAERADHKHGDATLTRLDETAATLSAGAYYVAQSSTASQRITVSGDVTLCLNGKALNAAFTVSSGAKLTLCDCSNSGTLHYTGSGSAIVVASGGAVELASGHFTAESGLIRSSGGTVTLSGGTFTVSGTSAITGTGAFTFSGGSFTASSLIAELTAPETGKNTLAITGGTYTNPAGTTKAAMFKVAGTTASISGTPTFTGIGREGYMIELGTGSTLTMSAGQLTSNGTGIALTGDASATITGGSFTGKIMLYLDAGASATVSGVTATCSDDYVFWGSGRLTVTSGTYIGKYIAFGAFNDLTIEGGTFTTQSNVICGGSGGKYTVKGGSYTLSGNSTSPGFAYSQSTATLTLSGTLDIPEGLRTMTVPSIQFALADDFALAGGGKLSLRCSTSAVVAVLDSGKVETFKNTFNLPEGYEWSYDETTRQLKIHLIGSDTHTHTDGTSFTTALTSADFTNQATIKNGSFLSEDVDVDIENYINMKGTICLAGHSLNLGAGEIQTSITLNLSSCTPANVTASINGNSWGYSHVTLNNLNITSAGDYTVKVSGSNSTTVGADLTMKNVTLRNTSQSGSTVILPTYGNVTTSDYKAVTVIENATITGPTGGSAVSMKVGSGVKLSGVVKITGGKGIDMSSITSTKPATYGIDATGLLTGSEIEVTLPASIGTGGVIATNVESEAIAQCFRCLTEGYNLSYNASTKELSAVEIRVHFDASGGVKNGNDNNENYYRINWWTSGGSLYGVRNTKDDYIISVSATVGEDGKRVFNPPANYTVKWNGTDKFASSPTGFQNRFDHEFLGWYTELFGGEKVTFPLDASTLTDSITVYAHWKPCKPVMTVRNQTASEDNITSASVVYGSALKLYAEVKGDAAYNEAHIQWYEVVDGKNVAIDGATEKTLNVPTGILTQPGTHTLRVDSYFVNSASGTTSEHASVDITLTVSPMALTTDNLTTYLYVNGKQDTNTYTGETANITYTQYVKLPDGTKLTLQNGGEYFTFTYTGTANDGTAYNATTPPTKAGSYTVTLGLTEAGAKLFQFDASYTKNFTITKATVSASGDTTNPRSLSYNGGKALDFFKDASGSLTSWPVGVMKVEYFASNDQNQPADAPTQVGETGYAKITIDTDNAEWSSAPKTDVSRTFYWKVTSSSQTKPPAAEIASVSGNTVTLKAFTTTSPETGLAPKYACRKSGGTAVYQDSPTFTVEVGSTYSFWYFYEASGSYNATSGSSVTYTHNAEDHTYKATFNPKAISSGTWPADITFTAGQEITLPTGEGFTFQDYTLVSWRKDSATSGTDYAPGAKVQLYKNATFYPITKATEPPANLTIVGPTVVDSGSTATLTLSQEIDLNRLSVTWYQSNGSGSLTKLAENTTTYTTAKLSYGSSLEIVVYVGNSSSKRLSHTVTATYGTKLATAAITPGGGTYGGTITPATVTFTGSDGKPVDLTNSCSLIYSGTANDGTTYSSTTPPTRTGTYTVTVLLAEKSGYTLVSAGSSAQFVVEKATVPAPTIASKPYTGSTLTADVATDSRYSITSNDGGIAAGDYPVVLTLKDSSNYKWETPDKSDAAKKTLTFTIAKASQRAPTAQVASKSSSAITMQSVTGAQYACVASGAALAESDWQTSNVFTGLTRNTAYDCYVRLAGDGNHTPSDAAKLTVTTLDAYSITYDLNGWADGTVPTAQTVDAGGSVTLHGITGSRDGYDLSGWATTASATTVQYTAEQTMTDIRANVTLYAVWSPTSYAITYDLGGGSVAGSNPTTYTVESSAITLIAPTRTGYTFKGWSGTGLTGDANTSVTIAAGSTGARTYTANWAPLKFTITYDGMEDATHGADHPTMHVYGTATVVPNPSRSGYTFSGWQVNGAGDPVRNLTLAADGYTAAITLTANWSVITDVPSVAPSAKVVTVPVSSDHAVVRVTATMTGSTATIEVSDAQIEQVAADGAGNVTIDLSGLNDADTAVIPAHVVKKIDEAEDTGLTVSLPTGTVNLDETALKSVAGGEDVTIRVERIATDALSPATREIIGTEPTVAAVVDIDILIGGQKQSTFHGGKLTISIPYTPSAGEDTSKLTVWFLRDDGTIENLGGHYDAEKQCFVFQTDHLSRYLLLDPGSAVFFNDVSSGSYCYDAVRWAAVNEITGGTGSGLFRPGTSCTRAQIVTFLWRAAGCPEVESERRFTDVPAGAYYEKAVAWAVENGITGGVGDGRFSPNAPCSRAQAVAFLYRAAGCPEAESERRFTDVPAGAYYEKAVAWAAENGITGGVGNDCFAPRASCTRAQIVTMLYRLLAQ